MTPYDALSEDARLERLRTLARKALLVYGLEDAQLSCLRGGKRPLLKATDASGARYALRLWPADESTAALDRELLWLTALRRDERLRIPEPILSTSGEWKIRVAMAGIPGFRCAVLLRWVDGRFFDSQLSASRLEKVGGLLAHIHRHGSAFASAQRWFSPEEPVSDPPSGFAGLMNSLEDGSIWSVFSGSTRALGEQTAPSIFAALERICAPAERGLIHGAVHQAHYLFHEEEAGLIGFSGCRIGHPIEDLASACRHLAEREGYLDLRDALLQGYSSQNRDDFITAGEIEAIAAAQHLVMPATPANGGKRAHRAILGRHLENVWATVKST